MCTSGGDPNAEAFGIYQLVIYFLLSVTCHMTEELSTPQKGRETAKWLCIWWPLPHHTMEGHYEFDDPYHTTEENYEFDDPYHTTQWKERPYLNYQQCTWSRSPSHNNQGNKKGGNLRTTWNSASHASMLAKKAFPSPCKEGYHSN